MCLHDIIKIYLDLYLCVYILNLILNFQTLLCSFTSRKIAFDMLFSKVIDAWLNYFFKIIQYKDLCFALNQ